MNKCIHGLQDNNVKTTINVKRASYATTFNLMRLKSSVVSSIRMKLLRLWNLQQKQEKCWLIHMFCKIIAMKIINYIVPIKIFSSGACLRICKQCTTNRVATDAFPDYQDQDATASPCSIYSDAYPKSRLVNFLSTVSTCCILRMQPGVLRCKLYV